MLEHLWFPHDISTFGPSIDWLFLVIFWITVITFLAVFITQLAFMWLYRARPGHKASYIEGNRNLEFVWTAATAVIVVVVALMSNSTWAEIKQGGPPGDVFYKVTGKQFNWEITYPGLDGKLGSADDFVMDNDLHIPVNKVVRIELEAKDVIHSFFVPNLRLKQDAVPGRNIQVWFVAKETGQYEIPCAELCGFGHSGMLGTLIVQSEDEYQQWMKERASGE
jgi:cytochrome c oxidase subunit 2